MFTDRAHLEDQIARHIEWSRSTFGATENLPLRIKGIADHLRKEVAEIAADPEDIVEYGDVVILGVDAAWRGGHSEASIATAVMRSLIERPVDLPNIHLTLSLMEQFPAHLAHPVAVIIWAIGSAGRRGFTRAELWRAWVSKHERNTKRSWPRVREGVPTEHLKVSERPQLERAVAALGAE